MTRSAMRCVASLRLLVRSENPLRTFSILKGLLKDGLYAWQDMPLS